MFLAGNHRGCRTHQTKSTDLIVGFSLLCVRNVYGTCYTCPASRFVMSLAVEMQGQKAYGLCTTALCAVLVVQFFP